jgi:hypothetical protein
LSLAGFLRRSPSLIESFVFEWVIKRSIFFRGLLLSLETEIFFELLLEREILLDWTGVSSLELLELLVIFLTLVLLGFIWVYKKLGSSVSRAFFALILSIVISSSLPIFFRVGR